MRICITLAPEELKAEAVGEQVGAEGLLMERLPSSGSGKRCGSWRGAIEAECYTKTMQNYVGDSIKKPGSQRLKRKIDLRRLTPAEADELARNPLFTCLVYR